MEAGTPVVKRSKHGVEESPGKSYYVLSKSLEVCGKCNKKCTDNEKAIQCDLCCMWVHADCENINEQQYKAIKNLSELGNSVYFCAINNCMTHFRSITNEWIRHQACGSSQPSIPTLSDNIESLTSTYNTIEKAVSDLSSKIVNLQSQECNLSEQIKSTIVALGRQSSYSTPAPADQRSNIVLYGVEESPPKALRHERLQHDVKAVLDILGGIKVQLNPVQILDYFRLGKFKPNQSRPRPILLKLQRIMDANIILANKTSLRTPLMVKPDMSLEERAIESVLLKERWSLIQSGHNRKQIKISKNQIYLGG